MKTIKQYLVRRGPDSALVQGALKAHGRLHGFKVNFSGDRIYLQKLDRDSATVWIGPSSAAGESADFVIAM